MQEFQQFFPKSFITGVTLQGCGRQSLSLEVALDDLYTRDGSVTWLLQILFCKTICLFSFLDKLTFGNNFTLFSPSRKAFLHKVYSRMTFQDRLCVII